MMYGVYSAGTVSTSTSSSSGSTSSSNSTSTSGGKNKILKCGFISTLSDCDNLSIWFDFIRIN